MGELKPQSGVPNVNVTWAAANRKASSPTAIWFRHIFESQARLFSFVLCVPRSYYTRGMTEHRVEMCFGARGK
jgi:hypothetical protein